MKNFDNYSEMPMKDGKRENTWFSNTIVNINGLSIANNFVVELTKSNADIIDEHLKSNNSYNQLFTKKIFEYHKLVKGNKDIKYDREALLDLIIMIDYENSTNIWRYKGKRRYVEKMLDFILDRSKCFWDKLEKGSEDLVDELNPEIIETKGPKSLASKICKYFSELFFEKDNYYINDTVVRHVLPYYLNYYDITTIKSGRGYFDSLSYKELHEYMDKLKERLDSNMKKDEIDRIMWYCYRFE